MADLSKTIQIVFEGVDNTATAISGLNTNLGDIAGKAEAATQPFADMAGAVIKADVAMAALAVTMVGWATGAATKFQTSISEINTLIGLSPENLNKFSKDILAYGTTSTKTFKDINGAVYEAISAGVAYDKALVAVAAAEKLAVAGKSSLGEAMDLLIPTLNAFGTDMKDAGTYSDIFFTAVNLGKTTIPELSQAMGGLAPTANAAGVPIGTVAAALATLTANGIKTNEASTGLKAALSNIIKPSKEAADAAAAMGVNFGVSALKTEGLEGLLKKLSTATGGNISEMARFFGSTEALNTVMSLTSGTSEKFTTNLNAMKTSAGATEAAYKIMAGSLELANVSLGNSIEAVGIKIGSKLLPDMTKLSKAMADVFNGVGQGVDDKTFDVPIKIVKQFLTDLSDILTKAAKALPDALKLVDWSDFEDSFAGLKLSAGKIFDGLDLTTPKGLAAAIQLVVDAISGVTRVSGGVIDGLKPLVTIIGTLVTGFTNLNPETQVLVGYFIGMATTVNKLSGYAKSLSDVFGAGAGLLGTLSKLSPVALAVGTAFAAFKFGEWVGEVTGYNTEADKLIAKLNGEKDAAEPAAAALGRIPEKLAEVSRTTGLTVTSMGQLDQLLKDGVIFWSDTEQAYVKAGTASNAFVKTTKNLIDVENVLNPALKDQYAAMGLAEDGTKKLGTEMSAVVKDAAYFDAALRDVDKAFKDGKISQDEYAKATGIIKDEAVASGISLDKLAKSEAAAAKDAKDLAAESEKFALEWGKLLSAERIAVFEASADIQVAQIEADSKRAVAAMEMLGASFANTGEVLTDLIGLWVGLEGMDQTKIEGWIEREYAIREALAQAQIDMVNAEIRRLEAQTALLERGGVELKITSDGLEPELEAFMFRIIDKVRVAVSGSYEEFLLGCGS